LYGIGKYDTNSACYEIIPSQYPVGTIFLDKCKGQTRILIKEDVDENEDGKADGYTYLWGRIGFADGEPIWRKTK
jgi:hypothetical protein